MDFKLSEELQAIRETARDFAEKEIIPFADKWENENYFPREVIKKMADLGFYGTLVPEKYGGNGMGFLAGAIITEEIARASASLRVTFNMQTFGPALSVYRYGTEEQKKKYIPKLVSAEFISCFAITEPNAGSDVMAMKTTAIPKGDYFLVNGSKTWISNAQVADLCVLYAYSDPAAKSKGSPRFSWICTSRESLPGPWTNWGFIPPPRGRSSWKMSRFPRTPSWVNWATASSTYSAL
jgi:glutaryl-CoA dehydrogenase (non-decarboxylating)